MALKSQENHPISAVTEKYLVIISGIKLLEINSNSNFPPQFTESNICPINSIFLLCLLNKNSSF